MKSTYSEAFIEQTLVKVFSPGSRSVLSITQELTVNYYTCNKSIGISRYSAKEQIYRCEWINFTLSHTCRATRFDALLKFYSIASTAINSILTRIFLADQKGGEQSIDRVTRLIAMVLLKAIVKVLTCHR